MMLVRILALTFACLRLSCVVFAHDPGLSTVQGRLTATSLELTVGFAPADAEEFLPAAERPGTRWGEREFESVKVRLGDVAPLLWDAQAGGRALAPVQTRVELLPGDNVSFFLVYPRPIPTEKITLRGIKLESLPSSHRQFVIINDEQGKPVVKKLLSAKDSTVEVGSAPVAANAAQPQDGSPTFVAFFKLGVTHILAGYDHLLFLFGLLVVCRTFRSAITIISCFTVAHAITLGLAASDVVNLPNRVTETVIAASIIYVGVENLIRRGEEPRGRWVLTFFFGLLHGFGFASVLRSLGVGQSAGGIAMPLFSFNLGVELGQIAIAALVLPIIWQLRKNDRFLRRGVPVLSGIVVAAGLYWLVERSFFG